ncbi:hypothetical protein ABKZ63_005456 [Salmonella enterica]
MKEVEQKSRKWKQWILAVTATIIIAYSTGGKAIAEPIQYSEVALLTVSAIIKGTLNPPVCMWVPDGQITPSGGTLGEIRIHIPYGKDESRYSVTIYGKDIKNSNGDMAMTRDGKESLYPVNMTVNPGTWQKRPDAKDAPIFVKDKDKGYEDLVLILYYNEGDILPGTYTATVNVQYSTE